MANPKQSRGFENNVGASCATLNCINDKGNGKKYCNKCHQRRYRENNKITASYSRLKYHAAERGIEFSVTVRYWEVFCNITEYHLLKGTGPDDLCIDRKIVTLGYTDYNIQVLTNRENGKKQHTVDRQERAREFQERMKKEWGGETPF